MVERPRCPTHVEQAALEPCTRCGGYFCSSCVGDAALDQAPASGRCPPCERLTRIAAPPIGGWLLLPLLQLAWIAVVALVQVIQALSTLKKPDAFGLYQLAFFGSVLGISAVFLFLFIKRKRAARMRLFGLFLVFSGLTAFLSILVPNESLVLLVSALLFLLAALGFVFSDRAKRTFVAR